MFHPLLTYFVHFGGKSIVFKKFNCHTHHHITEFAEFQKIIMIQLQENFWPGVK